MQPSSLIWIAVMVVAFYLLILRPQKKRQQAIAATQRSLEPGDRVLLGSGIFASVVSLGDKQAVLELSPGVELTVLKQAIARKATAADEDDLVDDDLDDDVDGPLDDAVEPLHAVDPVTPAPAQSEHGSSAVVPPEPGRLEQPRSAGADTSRLS